MSDWRDRIVEVKRMKVRDILAHERNPKKHPKPQADAMRGMLNEVGKADVLRAYYDEAGKLKLWDGHLRQGLDPDQEWWIAITDLTEAEAKKMLLGFDQVATMAERDAEALEALLHDVNVGDVALQAMLAQMAEEAGIVAAGATGPGGAGVDNIPSQWAIMVECADEIEQTDLLLRFEAEGLTCKALIS